MLSLCKLLPSHFDSFYLSSCFYSFRLSKISNASSVPQKYTYRCGLYVWHDIRFIVILNSACVTVSQHIMGYTFALVANISSVSTFQCSFFFHHNISVLTKQFWTIVFTLFSCTNCRFTNAKHHFFPSLCLSCGVQLYSFIYSCQSTTQFCTLFKCNHKIDNWMFCEI